MRFDEAWKHSGHGDPREDGGPGLPPYRAAYSRDVPVYWTDHLIAPVRTIGADTATSLKMSDWYSTVEDSPQVGDPNFISASLRTSAAMAWRDKAPSGLISMLPFEGAQWRFEQPVSFTQFHLPFDLMAMVCAAMFEKDLTHDHIRMPADVHDAQMYRKMEHIRYSTQVVEPTNLLLDSWALTLAETMIRGLSTFGEQNGVARFGKLPARGIARVVDYIEEHIDRDLRLSSLADIAGMSTYHFARRFHETVGLSPYSYILLRRVERAGTLLRNFAHRLVDVALACGFSNQAHMTTAFRRCHGMTPLQYRHSIR